MQHLCPDVVWRGDFNWPAYVRMHAAGTLASTDRQPRVTLDRKLLCLGFRTPSTCSCGLSS